MQHEFAPSAVSDARCGHRALGAAAAYARDVVVLGEALQVLVELGDLVLVRLAGDFLQPLLMLPTDTPDSAGRAAAEHVSVAANAAPEDPAGPGRTRLRIFSS